MNEPEIIVLSVLESKLLFLMPIGSENKLSIREIMKKLDVSKRATFEIINSLRFKGVPICAKRNGLKQERGYYIATNEAERTEGIAAYKSQVVDMHKLIKVIEHADLNEWHKHIAYTLQPLKNYEGE